MLPVLLLLARSHLYISIDEPKVLTESTGPVSFYSESDVINWLVKNHHTASDVAESVMNRIKFSTQLKTLAHQFIATVSEEGLFNSRSIIYISSALSVQRVENRFVVDVKKVTSFSIVKRTINGDSAIYRYITLVSVLREPIILTGEELNNIYSKLYSASRPYINQAVSQLM